MMGRMTAQRRSLCTWIGMAIGFRLFCAVIVDGGQLFGSAWLAMLMGLLLSIPAAAALIPVRRLRPELEGPEALRSAAGSMGMKLAGLILTVVLVYDAGALITLMTSTAKYVAMPEANRNAVKAVTAAAAVTASLMGASAAADAAVLWRRLAAALIAVLVITQAKYFRGAFLTPVLGPGVGEILKNALPAAGMLAFAAAGWLMLEPEHDQAGTAVLKSAVISGLTAAALALCMSMLVPGMPDEPSTRSFRIGRLLANGRAGLTLEMPYVILIYSGMLTALVFEVTAAARAAGIILPGVTAGKRVCLTGAAALGLSLSRWSEREVLRQVSMWYYPLIAAPFVLIGLSALAQMRRRGSEGGGA